MRRSWARDVLSLLVVLLLGHFVLAAQFLHLLPPMVSPSLLANCLLARSRSITPARYYSTTLHSVAIVSKYKTPLSSTLALAQAPGLYIRSVSATVFC